MKIEEILHITDPALLAQLAKVYPTQKEQDYQCKRLERVAAAFAELFGAEGDVIVCSAPGRTEISGNHTDHNHGKALAGAINLDTVAVASKRDDQFVCVKSEGRDMDQVDLRTLAPQESEIGKSVAMVRGVCAEFRRRGYQIGGFRAMTTTDVLSGSGLSSSAAFEVLICTILNELYNDGKVGIVEIAQIAQAAENHYFGKPCGLLDQIASVFGGFVTIDFADPAAPVVEKVPFDFASCGYALCIVDTGGSHSDLTPEFAAVRAEMESVAACFGKAHLREVDPADFYAKMGEIREKTGDRAVLRAMHFFADNQRVEQQTALLSAGDFEAFKELVIQSGRSSYMYNQNVYTAKDTRDMPLALALALSEKLLKGKGAWRVHGGGFAGTMQAFVPQGMLETYRDAMEAVFGKGSCHVLSIRQAGGTKIAG